MLSACKKATPFYISRNLVIKTPLEKFFRDAGEGYMSKTAEVKTIVDTLIPKIQPEILGEREKKDLWRIESLNKYTEVTNLVTSSRN